MNIFVSLKTFNPAQSIMHAIDVVIFFYLILIEFDEFFFFFVMQQL